MVKERHLEITMRKVIMKDYYLQIHLPKLILKHWHLQMHLEREKPMVIEMH